MTDKTPNQPMEMLNELSDNLEDGKKSFLKRLGFKGGKFKFTNAQSFYAALGLVLLIVGAAVATYLTGNTNLDLRQQATYDNNTCDQVIDGSNCLGANPGEPGCSIPGTPGTGTCRVDEITNDNPQQLKCSCTLNTPTPGQCKPFSASCSNNSECCDTYICNGLGKCDACLAAGEGCANQGGNDPCCNGTVCAKSYLPDDLPINIYRCQVPTTTCADDTQCLDASHTECCAGLIRVDNPGCNYGGHWQCVSPDPVCDGPCLSSPVTGCGSTEQEVADNLCSGTGKRCCPTAPRKCSITAPTADACKGVVRGQSCVGFNGTCVDTGNTPDNTADICACVANVTNTPVAPTSTPNQGGNPTNTPGQGGNPTNTPRPPTSTPVQATNTPGPTSTPGASDTPTPEVSATPTSGPTATPGQTADLELYKVVDDETPTVGQSVTYTITLANKGPDTASGIVVGDVITPNNGLEYLSHQAGMGTFDPNTGTWTVGALGANNATTLKITYRVLSSGTIVNLAQVKDVDQDDPDSTPNDGSGDDSDSTTLTPVVPTPTATLVPGTTATNTPVPTATPYITCNQSCANNSCAGDQNLVCVDVSTSGSTADFRCRIATNISNPNCGNPVSAPAATLPPTGQNASTTLIIVTAGVVVLVLGALGLLLLL